MWKLLFLPLITVTGLHQGNRHQDVVEIRHVQVRFPSSLQLFFLFYMYSIYGYRVFRKVCECVVFLTLN